MSGVAVKLLFISIISADKPNHFESGSLVFERSSLWKIRCVKFNNLQLFISIRVRYISNQHLGKCKYRIGPLAPPRCLYFLFLPHFSLQLCWSPLPLSLSYLFLITSFWCWTVVCLMKEDFLHLPVLKVVQLADSILGAGDQVHHDRHGTLSA